MTWRESIEAALAHPWVHASSWALGGVLAAGLWLLLARVLLSRVVGRTKNDLDDRALEVLRPTVALTLLLIGAGVALGDLPLDERGRYVVRGVVDTAAVLLWAGAANRLSDLLLEFLSHLQDRTSLVRPRTVPVFRIASRALVTGGAAYFLMLSWNVDVTGWLASAGIVGIAVGFAAKDTLANLFAGVFIIADTPYKLGDFLILESGERGMVTEIGMRSTRMLTRDDVEIIVPNAQMATVRIVNQSGGPHTPARVRCKVGVAYGSDVDLVRGLLLEASQGLDHVVYGEERMSPRVRFRRFGESGLDFELMVWVVEPVFQGRVLDALNTRVYKALGANGVEIPYPKRDIYLHRVDD